MKWQQRELLHIASRLLIGQLQVRSIAKSGRDHCPQFTVATGEHLLHHPLARDRHSATRC